MKGGYFAALQRAIPEPKAQEARNNVWILLETWVIINKRVSTRLSPERDQAIIQCLGHDINVSLKGYIQRRMEEAGEEIERILGADPPLHKEAWHLMKFCYKAVVVRAPTPAQVTFEQITAERVDLYRQVSPQGGNIPVSLKPFQVEDSVPTEDKI